MAQDSTKMLFAILCLTLVTSKAKSLPRKWYSDVENPENSSGQESFPRIKPYVHAHTQRKILSKGNHAHNSDDVASRADGKIIFPSDDGDILPQSYTPNFKPKCDGESYCEDTPDYPADFVEAALRRNKDLKHLAGVDLVPDVVHRVNSLPEDYSLCESTETIAFPKVGLTRENEWLFVVNQGNFTQGVRVELCRTENTGCNLIEGFAEGYKTMCKQKYIYRQLAAISRDGEIEKHMFRVPSSCCCHIKFDGNPLLRMGLNTNKKTEHPTSKMQRK